MAERKNYAIKPNLLAATPGIEASNGTTVSVVAEHAKVGKAAKVVCPGAASFEGVGWEAPHFVPAGSFPGGSKYTFSCWIWLAEGDPAIGKQMSANLGRQGTGGNDQIAGVTLAAGFNRFSGTFTSASTTTGFSLLLFFGSGAAKPASTFYVGTLLLEIAEAVGEYFDGSNPNAGWSAVWAGTANQSISTETQVETTVAHNLLLLGVGA